VKLVTIALIALAGTAAAAGAADKALPYLQSVAKPNLMQILPPPPASGSPGDADDRATFRETRKLQGSERWKLATSDVTTGPFQTFACAMNMQLDAARAPALARVLDRMGGGMIVDPVKKGYARRRPYLDDPLPICEAKTAHLAGNGDYPSGHTTGGWAQALVLAELMPERATPILQRGRVFGESRYICGAHSKSAVDAGFMAGAVVVSSLHASPEFRADMDAARAELAQLRATAAVPNRGTCQAERGTLATR
jgi:membrane-associated phospholipid phosphatase